MKRILFAILILLCPFGAMSQSRQGVLDNIFFSVDGGASIRSVETMDLQYVGSFMAGKWGGSDVGFRVGGWLGVPRDGSSKLLGAEFDFLWDPMVTFSPYDANRRLGCNVYAGAGLTLFRAVDGIDKEFFMNLGVSGTCRITNYLWTQVSLGSHIFSSGFMGGKGLTFSPYASLGLTTFLNENRYRRYHSIHTGFFFDDWYFAIGGGLNSMCRYAQFSDMVADPAVSVELGKHLNDLWEGRFRLSGIRTGLSDRHTNFVSLEADVMLSLLDIAQRRYKKDLNLFLYAGVSVDDDLSEEISGVIGIDGGVNVRCKVTGKSDVFVDLRGLLAPPRFTSLNCPVMVTASVGYVWNLGVWTWR